MSSLGKKGMVDFRQGSADRLELLGLHDGLLHSDLPTRRAKTRQEGIIDFKMQNHSSVK